MTAARRVVAPLKLVQIGFAVPTALRNLARRGAGRLARSALVARWRQGRRTLHILGYHGVCPDERLSEPWAPRHFVGAQAFARQLALLQRLGPVLPLRDALAALRDGLAQSVTAITFDDVAAGAFAYARPALAACGVRATFFVATGHASTGRLFNGDVLRLLRSDERLGTPEDRDFLGCLLHDWISHKRMPVEQLRAPLDRASENVRAQLPHDIYELLRPMNWSEIGELAAAGHEIGAHTVNHVVLGPQDEGVRRREIVESVATLRARLTTPITGFAYPNGGPTDYAAADWDVLKDVGIDYAVTTSPGFVTAHSPCAALPRTCIGAGHTDDSFLAAVLGLRSPLRSRS